MGVLGGIGGVFYVALWYMHVLDCYFNCVDLVGCAKAMVLVVNRKNAYC